MNTLYSSIVYMYSVLARNILQSGGGGYVFSGFH